LEAKKCIHASVYVTSLPKVYKSGEKPWIRIENISSHEVIEKIFPVMLNAFLFHAFLDLLGIGAAALAVIMSVFLMFRTKNTYYDLLKI